MAKAQISVSAVKAMKDSDVAARIKITGMREMRVRMWISTRLIMLGMWVIGGRTEIEETE